MKVRFSLLHFVSKALSQRTVVLLSCVCSFIYLCQMTQVVFAKQDYSIDHISQKLSADNPQISNLKTPLLVNRNAISKVSQTQNSFWNWCCPFFFKNPEPQTQSLDSFHSNTGLEIEGYDIYEEVVFNDKTQMLNPMIPQDIARHKEIANDFNHPDMWGSLMNLYNSSNRSIKSEAEATIERLAFTPEHAFAFRAARILADSDLKEFVALGKLAMLLIASLGDEQHQIQAIRYLWNKRPRSSLVSRMHDIAENQNHQFSAGAAVRLYSLKDDDTKDFAFHCLLCIIPSCPQNRIDIDWLNGVDIVEFELSYVLTPEDEFYEISREIPKKITDILKMIMQNPQHEIYLEVIEYILKYKRHERIKLLHDVLLNYAQTMTLLQKESVKKMIVSYMQNNDERLMYIKLLTTCEQP